MVLFNKLALLSLLGPYLHRQIQFIWVDFSSSSQSAHQACMGKTVTRDVSVQQLRTVIQSPEDVPVCLATMETTVSSVSVVVCTEVWLTEEIPTGQTIAQSKEQKWMEASTPSPILWDVWLEYWKALSSNLSPRPLSLSSFGLFCSKISPNP